MSAILESALDGERRAECAKHDMLANVNPVIADALRPFLNPRFVAEAASLEVQKLKPFLLVFGPRENPRLRMPVMARSTFDAIEQNRCCAIDADERIDALPYAKRSALRPEIDGLHAGGRS